MPRRLVHTSSVILFIVFAVVSVAPTSRAQGADTSQLTRDLLLYMPIVSGLSELVAYDPITGAHTTLAEPFSRDWPYAIDGRGRLAYASQAEGDQDIYLIDAFADPPTRINITNTPNAPESRLLWSKDGETLAFTGATLFEPGILFIWQGGNPLAIQPRTADRVGVQEDSLRIREIRGTEVLYTLSGSGMDKTLIALFNWQTGEESYITPDTVAVEPEEYHLLWGPDGRIAIEAIYRGREYFGHHGFSDVFLWDGEQTVEIPNPTGDSEFTPQGWSNEGQLALTTREDYVTSLFIWHGQSVTADGAPDVNSFTHVSAGFRTVNRVLWPPDNQLIFNAEVSHDDPDQYYLWDGTQPIDISQTPHYNKFGLSWSRDGRYLFTSDLMAPGDKEVHVRSPENERIASLPAESYGDPTWGANGYIAFCQSITLLVWDGTEVAEVTHGADAFWLVEGGYGTLCWMG